MSKNFDWKAQYSQFETNEEALINTVKSAEFIEQFKSHNDGHLNVLAEMFGTTNMSVNKKLGKLRKAGKVGYIVFPESDLPGGRREGGEGAEWSESILSNEASLELQTHEYLEIEEALKNNNIDLDVWEVVCQKRGFWTTPVAARVYKGVVVTAGKLVKNYSLKVTFRRKIPTAKEVAFEQFLSEIPKFKYSIHIPKFVAKSGIALEIAPVDAHFAKLAWQKETLREDYDLDIAVEQYLHVVEQNLAWGAIHKPEKIYLVVGNDLMHAENYEGTTPQGQNVLDIDSRLPRLIRTAMEINLKVVYRCRSVAPVEVVWIPGNHDPTSSLWLCLTLEQHFKDDKYVTIDASPSTRKARLWGDLLVGWTHSIVGKHAAWANELAQAFPELWGQSKFREWHHGHKHKKMEVKSFPVMTHGGVLCRQLTALSPIDAWHFEHLFTDAVPGSEAFLWSKDKGVFANLIAWL